MAKKKSNKIIKHRKGASKRWMRAVGGYSSLRYVSWFVLVIGLLALGAASFVFTQSKNIEFTPLPAITHTTELPDTGELLTLINNERMANNRTELAADDRLKVVAEKRLSDMIDSQQYSHKSLEGKYYYDLLRESDYASTYSCENLDIEPTALPAKFVRSWMSSGSGHKECLLSDKVSKVGIASGKFSTDDKTRQDNFLVVVVFASKPQEAPSEQAD